METEEQQRSKTKLLSQTRSTPSCSTMRKYHKKKIRGTNCFQRFPMYFPVHCLTLLLTIVAIPTGGSLYWHAFVPPTSTTRSRAGFSVPSNTRRRTRSISPTIGANGKNDQRFDHCGSPVDSVTSTSSALLSSSLSTPTSSSLSAAQWHRQRRQQMLAQYGDHIRPLERSANSQSLGLCLLVLANFTLAAGAVLCGRIHSLPVTLLLSLFPGSILSLWQLQILHDDLHGCLLDKTKTTYKICGMNVAKQRLQSAILFWGSMPNIFGYYLYLQYGHLTHHQNVGDPQKANLRQVFESDQVDFEDGDVLFVSHRMRLLGSIGPRFVIRGKEIILSISRLGFGQWKQSKQQQEEDDDKVNTTPNSNSNKKLARAIWNMGMFAMSFWYERVLLTINDVVVALTGRNYFFPNKPPQFHKACARYCRAAVAMRAILWWLGGQSWHALLFLFGAETLWSIPPHPSSAMFVTNHGSTPNDDNHSNNNKDNALGASIIAASPPDACVPSSSTYAGKWYSTMTLGTNYHCEHHDFPTIPFQRLYKLRQIAPEYYANAGSKDKLWPIMVRAFADPDYYACMNDMESIRVNTAQ